MGASLFASVRLTQRTCCSSAKMRPNSRCIRTTEGYGAIAGLSMGGAQALYIGLNHQDRFAWVGSFSGAFVMYGERLEEWFPELTLSANPRLHLLWMACGTEDFLLGVNHKCTEWLKSKDVQFTAIETRGTHAWQVWRRNLTEFTPLLFRGRRSSRAAGRTNWILFQPVR